MIQWEYLNCQLSDVHACDKVSSQKTAAKMVEIVPALKGATFTFNYRADDFSDSWNEQSNLPLACLVCSFAVWDFFSFLRQLKLKVSGRGSFTQQQNLFARISYSVVRDSLPSSFINGNEKKWVQRRVSSQYFLASEFISLQTGSTWHPGYYLFNRQ